MDSDWALPRRRSRPAHNLSKAALIGWHDVEHPKRRTPEGRTTQVRFGGAAMGDVQLKVVAAAADGGSLEDGSGR